MHACAPSRSTTSSVTSWIDAREVHLALRELRFRLRAAGRRTARRSAPLVIVRPVAVVEVLHVQAERAVGLHVDQLLVDQSTYFGSPYGASPISLYSPELTLKPVK